MSYSLGYPGAGRGGRGSVRAVLTTSPPNFYVPPMLLLTGGAAGGAEKSLGLCVHGSAKIRHSWVISTAFSTTPKQSCPGSYGQMTSIPVRPVQDSREPGKWGTGARCWGNQAQGA